MNLPCSQYTSLEAALSTIIDQYERQFVTAEGVGKALFGIADRFLQPLPSEVETLKAIEDTVKQIEDLQSTLQAARQKLEHLTKLAEEAKARQRQVRMSAITLFLEDHQTVAEIPEECSRYEVSRLTEEERYDLGVFAEKLVSGLLIFPRFVSDMLPAIIAARARGKNRSVGPGPDILRYSLLLAWLEVEREQSISVGKGLGTANERLNLLYHLSLLASGDPEFCIPRIRKAVLRMETMQDIDGVLERLQQELDSGLSAQPTRQSSGVSESLPLELRSSQDGHVTADPITRRVEVLTEDLGISRGDTIPLPVKVVFSMGLVGGIDLFWRMDNSCEVLIPASVCEQNDLRVVRKALAILDQTNRRCKARRSMPAWWDRLYADIRKMSSAFV